MAGIAEATEMRILGMRISFESLVNEAPTLFIIPWRQKHFVVIYKTSKKTKIWIADPAQGLLTYSVEDFRTAWADSIDATRFVNRVLLHLSESNIRIK